MSDAVYSADYRFESPTKLRLAHEHRERRLRNLVPLGQDIRIVQDSGIDLRSGRAKGVTGWVAALERAEAKRKKIEAEKPVEKPVEKPTVLDENGNVLRDWIDVATKYHIADVIRETALQFGVTEADIKSARRTADVVAPRHVAMNLSKHLTLRSLPEIGRKIGMRDHTTVLHAIRKYENAMAATINKVPERSPVSVWVAVFKREMGLNPIVKRTQFTGKAIEKA